MSEPKRYDFSSGYCFDEGESQDDPCMKESETGEYVLYSDLAREKERSERLREVLEQAAFTFGPDEIYKKDSLGESTMKAMREALNL